MALGMIGTALVSVAKGLSGFTWWQYIVLFVAILLVISGPSMIMAWLKLRRRNLAPVLNANGWAVNSDALISVIFGRTLTDQVAFPVVKLPKVKKGLKAWHKWCIAIGVIVILALGAWGIYAYTHRNVQPEQVEANADTTAVETIEAEEFIEAEEDAE